MYAFVVDTCQIKSPEYYKSILLIPTSCFVEIWVTDETAFQSILSQYGGAQHGGHFD